MCIYYNTYYIHINYYYYTNTIKLLYPHIIMFYTLVVYDIMYTYKICLCRTAHTCVYNNIYYIVESIVPQ